MVVTPAPNMTPAPPPPPVLFPSPSFLCFIPETVYSRTRKYVDICPASPLFPQTAHTLILFCTFLLAIHQGEHTTSVQNRFLILFFFLSNCMRGDQGGKSFCCNHCFPGAVWLGGQTLRSVSEPDSHRGSAIRSLTPCCWACKPE